MPALLTMELCTGIIAPTTGQLLMEPLRWLLQRPNFFGGGLAVCESGYISTKNKRPRVEFCNLPHITHAL